MNCNVQINIVGYSIYANGEIFILSKDKEKYDPILTEVENGVLDISNKCVELFNLPITYILPQLNNCVFLESANQLYINFKVELPLLFQKHGYYWVNLKDNLNNEILRHIYE